MQHQANDRQKAVEVIARKSFHHDFAQIAQLLEKSKSTITASSTNLEN